MTYYDELREHYKAVKNRLRGPEPVACGVAPAKAQIAAGGVARPTGVVPARTAEVMAGLAAGNKFKFDPSEVAIKKRRVANVIYYRRILHEVAERLDIPPKVIEGRRRWKPVAQARHEVWFRAYIEHDYSVNHLAKIAGVDHTTLMHGIRAHASRLANGSELSVV